VTEIDKMEMVHDKLPSVPMVKKVKFFGGYSAVNVRRTKNA
jgi:hypothetical protein